MGIPAADIERWPEPEIRRYMAYADQFMLPMRRIEHYHAQTALLVARVMGGYKGGLADFLFADSHRQVDDAAADGDGGLFDDFNPA